MDHEVEPIRTAGTTAIPNVRFSIRGSMPGPLGVPGMIHPEAGSSIPGRHRGALRSAHVPFRHDPAVAGVVPGRAAESKMRRSPDIRGKGPATAGLVIGDALIGGWMIVGSPAMLPVGGH